MRKTDLIKKLQIELLAKQGEPVVIDYDWKIKWIIGSSSLSSIREPIVQIDLHTLKISETNENITDTIQFEMNINEFKQFKENLLAAKFNFKKS